MTLSGVLRAQTDCEVTLAVEPASVYPDQEEICVNVTVRGFEDILSIVQPISYPAEYLSYTSMSYSAHEGMTVDQDTTGLIVIKWEDNTGVGAQNLVEDTDILITLCFEVLEIPADDIHIAFGDYTDRSTTIITSSELYVMEHCSIDGYIEVPCTRQPLEFIFRDIVALDTFCDISTGFTELTAWRNEHLLPFHVKIYADSVLEVDMLFDHRYDKHFWDYRYDQPYYVEVTNPAGCMTDTTITYQRHEEGEVLTFSSQDIGHSCEYSNNGYIEFTMGSGDWPNTYVQWDHGPGSPYTRGNRPYRLDGLSAGTYSVTVSHSSCEVRGTFVVENIPQVEVNQDITPPQCGSYDGRIVVTVSPSDDYTYQWNIEDGADGRYFRNAGIGVYEVDIISPAGCITTERIVIDTVQPVTIEVYEDYSDCSQSKTLRARPSYDGGRHLQYHWSTGETERAFDSAITVDEPGIYWAYGDNGDCLSDTIYYEILFDNISYYELDTIIVTPPECHASSGRVEFVMDPPDAYDFLIGLDTYSHEIIDDIAPGEHEVEIYNPSGCSILTTFTMPTPVVTEVSIDSAQSTFVICEGESASVHIQHNGATLRDGAGRELSSPLLLPAGSHTIYSVSSDGCRDSIEIQIDETVSLDFSLSWLLEDFLCEHDATAIYPFHISEDIGPDWIISWNGQLTDWQSELNAHPGINTIEIITPEGCAYYDEHEVTSHEFEGTIDTTLYVKAGDMLQTSMSHIDDDFLWYIEWTASEEVVCLNDTCNQIQIVPMDSYSYEFTLIDTFGCMTLGALQVIVEEPDSIIIDTMTVDTSIMDTVIVDPPVMATTQYYLPNAIRKGSAQNGAFCIHASSEIVSVESFSLFDRWGGRRAHASGLISAGQFCLDAQATEELSTGVYVYAVVLVTDTGERVTATGDVTVL